MFLVVEVGEDDVSAVGGGKLSTRALYREGPVTPEMLRNNKLITLYTP